MKKKGRYGNIPLFFAERREVWMTSIFLQNHRLISTPFQAIIVNIEVKTIGGIFLL